MTLVHTNDGRTVEIDPEVLGTYAAGEAADLLAFGGDDPKQSGAYGNTHPGQFSFKADGVVRQRSDRMGDHLADGTVVELVDVTEYVWPSAEGAQVGEAIGEERHGIEVPLGETGTLVVGDDAGLHPLAAPLALVVPDGTVEEIADWVDGNAVRAKAALEAETAKDKPRTTLVEHLEAVIEAGDESTPASDAAHVE